MIKVNGLKSNPLNHTIIIILQNLLFFLFSINIKYKYRKNKCFDKSQIINIFSFLSILILSESKKLNFNSEITITIQGSGTQQIISDNSGYCSCKTVYFGYIPDKIYVNGVSHSIGNFIYDLVKETNETKMVWYDPLIDCNGMFYGLSNITSIDFSNFDGSHLIDIRCMFGGCSSLQYLDLRNFNSSLIEDMDSLFKGCRGLISIDITSFDTIKVKNKYDLFYGCKSLTSIDVSKFDTSGVKIFATVIF